MGSYSLTEQSLASLYDYDVMICDSVQTLRQSCGKFRVRFSIDEVLSDLL
jgi:hypothetical protein